MVSPKHLEKFYLALQVFIRRIGVIFSVFYPVLILIIVLQVVLRYFFKSGLVVLEELQWHLYAVCIMIGISYTLTHDGHIRLDLFYEKFTPTRKNLVDFLGILFLLLPMAAVLFWHSLGFVTDSWRVAERSVAPMGLPYRWIIKSFIPISALLIMVAAVSRMLQCIVQFMMKPEDTENGCE